MKTDLVEKLKVELIEQLNLEEITSAEIDPAAPLFGDGLGLDSIDALEIIVLLEKEYGIKITDQALGKEAMQSINSLAAFIKSNSK
jgi:acyl carrier protein